MRQRRKLNALFGLVPMVPIVERTCGVRDAAVFALAVS